MINTLEKIINVKNKEVLDLKNKYKINELEKLALDFNTNSSFYKNLIKKSKNNYGIIAEVKKASPSKGVLRENFSPVEISKAYKEGGASCLSILTDQKFFKGDLKYINLIKDNVDLPILRKDFIIDPIQIFESKINGADCILLIVACLEPKQMKTLYDLALSLKLDVLIEVHDLHELDLCLKLDPYLIGINNRNLKNMKTTIDTSIEIAQKVPNDILIVSESGINSREDLDYLSSNGINCFLIGETFMKSNNIKNKLKHFLEVH